MTLEDARVGFALLRLEAGDDGLLEVEGEWSNVRGMRFVRPALVLRDGEQERTLLAVLDHKPWNPDGRPWRAAPRRAAGGGGVPGGGRRARPAPRRAGRRAEHRRAAGRRHGRAAARRP